MGLDGVEIVMELEERFGVELDREELVKTETPRMLGDLIFSKLESTGEDVCQTQRCFYLLRNAFMRLFDLPRDAVKLETRVRDFIPRSEERNVWPKLGEAVDARTWPELERPVWLLGLINWLCFGVVGLAFLVGFGSPMGLLGGILLAVIGIPAALLFACFLFALTKPFKLRIPRRFRTIRDLVPIAITSRHISWDRDVVSIIVTEVVADVLGVDKSQFTEDSHFVRDLGVG